MNYIEKHNKEASEGKHPYTLDVNQFSDLVRLHLKIRYFEEKNPVSGLAL